MIATNAKYSETEDYLRQFLEHIWCNATFQVLWWIVTDILMIWFVTIYYVHFVTMLLCFQLYHKKDEFQCIIANLSNKNDFEL